MGPFYPTSHAGAHARRLAASLTTLSCCCCCFLSCCCCCWCLQEERQSAAEALVTALVDSQKQYDATHRAKSAEPAGSFDQEGGNRQQRMEQCLSCCSPLMVSPSLAS